MKRRVLGFRLDKGDIGGLYSASLPSFRCSQGSLGMRYWC